MILLTNEENELYEIQKFVISAKTYLVLIKTMKLNLNYIIKEEIIVIIQENLEELLIIFVTYDTKHPKNF